MRDGLLPYNKDTTDKRRPTLMTSPRQRQRKAVADDLAGPIIKDLSARLEVLTKELLEIKQERATENFVEREQVPGLYTEEQVNELITEALMKEMKEGGTSDTIIKSLKDELAELKQQLIIRDVVIKELKTLEIQPSGSTFVTGNSHILEEGETIVRPSMEDNVVIDPSEDTGLESHINIDAVPDETASTKEEAADKLAKLKDILG